MKSYKHFKGAAISYTVKQNLTHSGFFSDMEQSECMHIGDEVKEEVIDDEAFSTAICNSNSSVTGQISIKEDTAITVKTELPDNDIVTCASPRGKSINQSHILSPNVP